MLLMLSSLTDSKESRKNWSVLKNRLKKEGIEVITKCSQLSEKIGQLKMLLLLEFLMKQLLKTNLFLVIMYLAINILYR